MTLPSSRRWLLVDWNVGMPLLEPVPAHVNNYTLGPQLVEQVLLYVFESFTGCRAVLQLSCCPSKQGELLENTTNLFYKLPPQTVVWDWASRSYRTPDWNWSILRQWVLSPVLGFTQNEVQVESTSSKFWGDQEVFVGDTLELSCTGSGSAVTAKWSKAGADRLEDNVRQQGNVLR